MEEEPAHVQGPVQISEAAAAAIAVRPIPREAVESGALVAAEIAVRRDRERRLQTGRDEEDRDGQ
ncbi:hypothetical protein B0O41_3921 [Propionibacteriaceae bacterium ES.041]|nr:hypothetical protein B0O41_3921 [Propionibacteriaceae bacterium ES.041]